MNTTSRAEPTSAKHIIHNAILNIVVNSIVSGASDAFGSYWCSAEFRDKLNFSYYHIIKLTFPIKSISICIRMFFV